MAGNLALQLYAAASGEPALGPVAFMHRPSAFDDPMAPIGHHWQDATHITFGVVTAGVFTRQWKLEGSVFNGREPDGDRWGFDFDRLDSYSGRLTWNPGAAWSLTAGYGHLRETEHSLHRVAGSILHGKPIRSRGQWASTLVYGANRLTDEKHGTHSILLESEATLDPANTLFGRAEWVEKSEHDLGVGTSESRTFGLGTASAGYIRELVRGRGMTVGLGVRGSLSFLPASLEPFYGSRHPVGRRCFCGYVPPVERGREPWRACTSGVMPKSLSLCGPWQGWR